MPVALFFAFGFGVAGAVFFRFPGDPRGAVGVLAGFAFEGICAGRAETTEPEFLGQGQSPRLVVAVFVVAEAAFFAQDLPRDRVFAAEGEPSAGA